MGLSQGCGVESPDLEEISSVVSDIVSIVPNSGSTRGGTPITLKGSQLGLGGCAKVFIGATECTNVKVFDGTVITCTTGRPQSNVDAFYQDVHVENCDGSRTFSASYFSYIQPTYVGGIDSAIGGSHHTIPSGCAKYIAYYGSVDAAISGASHPNPDPRVDYPNTRTLVVLGGIWRYTQMLGGIVDPDAGASGSYQGMDCNRVEVDARAWSRTLLTGFGDYEAAAANDLAQSLIDPIQTPAWHSQKVTFPQKYFEKSCKAAFDEAIASNDPRVHVILTLEHSVRSNSGRSTEIRNDPMYGSGAAPGDELIAMDRVVYCGTVIQKPHVFDEPFYLQSNPDVAAAVQTGTYRSGYDHFVRQGYADPKRVPVFDERYYLRKNPDVSAAVKKGLYVSGLDHYIKVGRAEDRIPYFDNAFYLDENPDVLALLRSGVTPGSICANEACTDRPMSLDGFGPAPTRFPFFDEAYYLAANPDVRTAVVAGTFKSGYDHFVQVGRSQGRQHHKKRARLLSADLYNRSNLDVQEALRSGQSVSEWQHLEQVGYGDAYAWTLRDPNRARTPLFDDALYLTLYPDAALAIQLGQFPAGFNYSSALSHYVRRGRYEGRVPYVDEVFYLEQYPDVLARIRAGALTSARQHYIDSGRAEGRRPSFDEGWYLRTYSDAATAVHAGTYRSGYDHWLEVGKSQGKEAGPLLRMLSGSHSLSVTPNVVNSVSSTMTVSWTAPSPHEWTDDRICMYKVGDSRCLASKNVGAGASGSLTFDLVYDPPSTDGDYEFRYLDGAVTKATSNKVALTFLYSLAVSPSTASFQSPTLAGNDLTVHWMGPTGGDHAMDEVRLYKVGVPDSSFVRYDPSYQTPNFWYAGNLTQDFKFPVPWGDGEYELRYFAYSLSGFTRKATSNKVTVSGAVGYSVQATPTSVMSGASITCSWTASSYRDASQNVGLFNVADTEFAAPLLLVGLPTTYSGSFSVAAPMAPGEYEFRYLGFGRKLATSSKVIVTEVPYSLASTGSVGAGGNIALHWTAPFGRTGHDAEDWIGLHKVGDPDSVYSWTFNVSRSATSGDVTAPAPLTGGDYELRFFASSGGGFAKKATSNPVTVSPYGLSAGPGRVLTGGDLSVTWIAPSGRDATDWVGLYKVGAPDSAYGSWKSTGGMATGVFNTVAPSTAGEYEFRYFLSGGYVRKAVSNPIIITAPPPFTLSASPASVIAGGSVTVKWTARAGHYWQDSITLYRVGDPDNSPFSPAVMSFTTSETSGSATMTMPNAAGDYEFRYIESGYTYAEGKRATSNKVSVSAAPAYSLTASPASVTVGGNVTIAWTAPAGRDTNDWVGLYKVGDPDSAYGWWKYTAGAASGSFTSTAPATAGDYEFRYFVSGGFVKKVTSNKVTVTAAPTRTLTAGPGTIAPGGTITVYWTAPAGSSAKDWVAFYKVGDPNTTYGTWIYTNGTASGSATFTAPAVKATYEFRYLLDNGFTSAVTSNNVVVN